MVNQAIAALIEYALQQKLIEEDDVIWARNSVLDILGLDRYERPKEYRKMQLHEILDILCDQAYANGVMEENSVVYRDLLDTKIMGALTPPPREVRRRFFELYQNSPKEATDAYYKLAKDTNYIRTDRIAKDVKFQTRTAYGDLDITINLSKPEKDPKAIAAAKLLPQSSYPKCLLCRENEGYAGRLNHPARQNHRIIPVRIADSNWYLQYSPYVYYNEHCIVFNGEHTPMKIEEATFRKLLDFVKQFPHYFVGSNADLPIVGGSILSHDHFQGGCYTFAMAKAEIEQPVSFMGYEDVEAGIVKWPMSVLRLRSKDDRRLVALGGRILSKWRIYSDEKAYIFAQTSGEMHNTITPIARQKDGVFELDLVLRNNITTEEHPLGLYHPHAELHHIKKENIGLIEVMGLAVLPARLKEELHLLETALVKGEDIRSNPAIEKHADWAENLQKEYTFTKENAEAILQKEVGIIFEKVLEHAGVYARDEAGLQAFLRFTEYVNLPDT